MTLEEVLQQARVLLDRSSNDFSWSSWENKSEACAEIDELLTALRDGTAKDAADYAVLFLPTGPIQEVALSSGWGEEFLQLAEKADRAIENYFANRK